METLLLQELNLRWHRLFQQLRDGADVPPSRRLRLEGLMEAAQIMGLASGEQIQQAMEDAYREVNGRDLSTDFSADWRHFFPFPQIPAMARRAPVYASTR